MNQLSVLICSLDKRLDQLDGLLKQLYSQRLKLEFPNQVQFRIERDNGEMSVGAKRNKLLERATGEYLCFCDDDDKVSDNYLELLVKATESGCDCASLKGQITIDGGPPEIFEHSLKYNEWLTNPEGAEIRYERYPNHLNLIKSSIAKKFKFPEKSHGEDHDWSRQIHESGLLKTEHYIPEVIYYYNYISNK
jgi:glycosyltransferase involved in cell wall biosynthesis